MNVMKKMALLVATMGLALAGCMSVAPVAQAVTPPIISSLIVMPHPDDESQAWSLIQNSPSNFKIFAYMTRGEATGYCPTYPYGLDAPGEVAPSGGIYPSPWAKGSQGCVNARLGSNFNTLTKMGTVDSTLPTGYTYRGTYTLPSDGTVVSSRVVAVYSGGTFGTILSFNMGDGNLTSSEVVWAIHSIQNNLGLLGIPALPIHNILGPYRNLSNPGCAVYDHPDHYAIQSALFNTTFANVAYSAAPTCASDPDVVRTADVTTASWNSLWAVNGSNVATGFAQKYYGWLTPGHWIAAVGGSQSQIFMEHQSFWQHAG